MKEINNCYWILLLLFIAACSGELSPTAYIEWVQDPANGLHKQKQVGDFMFDIQYKPAAYLVIQRNQGKLPPKKQAEAAMAEMKEVAYFELKLGAINGQTDLLRYKTTGQADYDKKIYYYSFKFQEAIYLEQEGRKIPCSAYHFERAYNLKNNRSFTLGFDGIDTSKPMKVVIDSEVLNTGPVKLAFNSSNTPLLKLVD